MNRDEMKTVVFSALAGIAPEVEATALDPGGDLREQLDLDSMDFLNLMVALHEATGVEVPERDYGRLATLDALVDYLLAPPVGAGPCQAGPGR